MSNDLTADGNNELAGYWGGFSGDVDGQVFGFLSPLFNGNEFHGNAVQVHLVTANDVCPPRARSATFVLFGAHSQRLEGSLEDGRHINK